MGIRIQVVEITFSDGRIGRFTGPVVVEPEDEDRLTVTDVRVFRAVTMPDEYSFEEITRAQVDTSEQQ